MPDDTQRTGSDATPADSGRPRRASRGASTLPVSAAPSHPPRRVAGYRSFPASLTWSLAGTLLPGLGLMRSRHKIIGGMLLAVTLLLLVTAAIVAMQAPQAAVSALLSPGVLQVAWVAVLVVAAVWIISIIATHLSLRPVPPKAWQRLVGSLFVGVLALAVALPSFMGARALYDTATLVNGVFGDERPGVPGQTPFGNPVDPWANKPRLNVLILGGDSGQARAEELGARTDTVILASIDTRTGDSVLFSLPRQTQHVPFPASSPLSQRYPDGFPDLVNAIYDTVPKAAPDALPAGVEDPGAEALKLGIGEALGLPVDYYAMINMDGFIEFVNALGGITVNINRPVPVGGNTTRHTPPDRWLPPGPDQHLNGWDALWYARGRYGEDTGDYARMGRQRCVIQAVVKQASPTTVLANYEALSRAGRNIVATDMPSRQAPAMLALGMRVKDGTMTSVSFQHGKDGFDTVRPNWAVARQRVQTAINPPPPAPAPDPAPAPTSETPSATPTATRGRTTASATPAPTQPATPASVEDECAYHPVEQ